MLDVPEGIKLLQAVPADADPRLIELQTLENWIRVYKAHATGILRQLWAEKNHSEEQLAAATGMTRFGNRKRADPEFNEAVNERRRVRRGTTAPDDPGEEPE